jgi:high-affinity nickel-transport protein
MTRGEWRRFAGLGGAVIGLHVLGFAILLLLVVPHHFSMGKQGVFGLGVGITAYTLGLRHAFDADHISAIDNTTRKLMAQGQRPISVGFWFSLGHSTVVFALAGLVSVGVRALDGQVLNGHSGFHRVAAALGTSVSGGFLYAIAALNLIVLVRVVGLMRAMRRGGYDDAALQAELDSRGLIARFCPWAVKLIRKPWHMYPLGFLFGLGFDTATEVVLLFMAVGATGAGLPLYAILCLPVLFAAGMSLADTLDGSFMNFAYGWALSQPSRKIYYNVIITALSVAVALVIGTVELGGALGHSLGARGPAWTWLESVNVNTLGYLIVALFVATWLMAWVVWRLGRFEQRWG